MLQNGVLRDENLPLFPSPFKGLQWLLCFLGEYWKSLAWPTKLSVAGFFLHLSPHYLLPSLTLTFSLLLPSLGMWYFFYLEHPAPPTLCLFTSTTLSNPTKAIIVLVSFSLFCVPAESLSYLESSRSRCWMRIHVQVLRGRTMKMLGVRGKDRKAQCLSQSSEEQITRWHQALESFIGEMSIWGNG